MRDKILGFLRANTHPGEHLIVAASGGKDSMALLHAVSSLRDELGTAVSCAHFDHMLRGEESERDAAFVKAQCESRQIPFFCGRGNVTEYAKTHHLGPEAAARAMRYDFLLSIDPNAWLLTAHTAEANLETVLMPLIRGSGLHGLTGIALRRDRILRPMLEVSRQEVLDYLAKNRIPHVEDSSNSLDNCLRNRIRHRVLPLLEEENPALVASTSQLIRTLRDEDAWMDKQAGDALADCMKDGSIRISSFLSLDEVLQYRVLRMYLEPVPQLGRVHLTSALELCRGKRASGWLELPGGYVLTRSYDLLHRPVRAAEAPVPEPMELRPGQTILFGAWRISCRVSPRPDVLPQNTAALAAASVSPPFLIRCRRPGDVIRLPGGSKKLSRLMIDEKIPARLRDGMPVVIQNNTVLALLPCRTAAQCLAKPGAGCYLLLAERLEDV